MGLTGRAGAGTRARLKGCLVVLLLATVGCTSLPSAGPVHRVEDAEASPADTSAGAYYDPAPPRRDATPDEVVGGFLEAMKAIPVSTNVAQRYLSTKARALWEPEQGVITYEVARANAQADSVVVSFTGAGRYDATGKWKGWLDQRSQTVTFNLVREAGQWRIASLPNALVVPSTWFAEQYQRAAVYAFDPTGSDLVPETAFVARGDQLSTQLVRGLLTPVSDELSDVVRSSIPTGIKAGLSVPVTDDGVAQIDLTGTVPALTADDRQRLAAQFVWTLRQDPRVRALRVTLNGRSLGSAGDVAMNSGDEFDPVGATSDPAVYAVRGDTLMRGTLSDLRSVPGAKSPLLADARSMALTPDGSRLAVVPRAADSVWVGKLGRGGGEATALKKVAAGTTLRQPAWDLRGRMWMLDGGRSSRIRVLEPDGAIRTVDTAGVPELSRQRVRQLLVSPDGTRVVALVSGSVRDTVVVARVRQNRAGRVLGLTAVRELWYGLAAPDHFRMIGWQGPTAVAAISSAGSAVTQIQVAGVDGAPVPVADPVQVRGRAVRLLSSPYDATRVLVLTSEGVQDSATQSLVAVDDPDIRLLQHTG